MDDVKHIHIDAESHLELVRELDIRSTPTTLFINKDGVEVVSINHFNVILQFLKGKRTFGESYKLRNYIRKNFTLKEFAQLKALGCDIVVTVTNLSKNEVEYKSIKDFEYNAKTKSIEVEKINFKP